MQNRLQTPGIYVQEISTADARIRAVATDITAFIGYTEKAQDGTGKILRLKPTPVRSLTEYEQLFGGPQPETNLVVEINTAAVKNGVNKEKITVVFAGPRSAHTMYYALKAFFLNGGSTAYIIAVGVYKQPGAVLSLRQLEKGVAALRNEPAAALVVVPEAQALGAADCHNLYQKMLAACAGQPVRFAILDFVPHPASEADQESVLEHLRQFRDLTGTENLRYGAAYFPNLSTTFSCTYNERKIRIRHTHNGRGAAWNGKTLAGIKKVDINLYNRIRERIDACTVVLPPSPFIAGVYARVDSQHGVWKAPANVQLTGVAAPQIAMTEQLQEAFSIDAARGISINVIRSFTGRGLLVWGARTLAGNDPEWRYVPVRRLCNMIESSCTEAARQLAGAPNDSTTWAKLRMLTEQFLYDLWRMGALQGTKPEMAYFVRIGLGSTMTENDIKQGLMILEIGVAPVRPAEFVILRIVQHMIPDTA